MHCQNADYQNGAAPRLSDDPNADGNSRNLYNGSDGRQHYQNGIVIAEDGGNDNQSKLPYQASTSEGILSCSYLNNGQTSGEFVERKLWSWKLSFWKWPFF